MSGKGFATFHDLAGQTVFITGGGAGIGAALTEGFAAQGAKVAFVQRSDASGLADRLRADYETEVLFLPCDITDLGDLTRVMQEVVDRLGPVTILVNNAANDTRHTIAETTEDDWQAAMDVNLRPHFFTTRFFAPGMREAGGGAIVNYSSISYMMGLGGLPAYVAAKAGITGLTRGLARELGLDGIRVNAIMPGWVLTERQLRLWATEEGMEKHLGNQCLKEHLAPEDMVGGTLFLSSKASRMMTGQALVIDGGVVFSGC